MRKQYHEIRDPIHDFVRFDTQERRVVDSRPFQRLRHIHQLGTTHFVYPAANHTRFEHSLGTMALATRVYDTITSPEHLTDDIRDRLPQVADEDRLRYWRRVLRVAALCHDLGHLPFSHAAEADLLPHGVSHEALSDAFIRSDEMEAIWTQMEPTPTAARVSKLALGFRKYSVLYPADPWDLWEAVLAEIIPGNAFGVDRMDYLLRDAHHLGVAYGKFDVHRLVDSIRILPPAPSGEPEEVADAPHDPAAPVGAEGAGWARVAGNATTGDRTDAQEQSRELGLGIEEGGLQCAEGLLVARHFMFAQVYFHHVRRIYDLHLKDFLLESRGGETLPVETVELLKLTDNEIMSAMLAACHNDQAAGHAPARRILQREHFRRVYSPSPADRDLCIECGPQVAQALRAEFGDTEVLYDYGKPTGGPEDFAVQLSSGEVASSTSLSDLIAEMPSVRPDFVFVAPGLAEKARHFIKENRETILTDQGESPEDEQDAGRTGPGPGRDAP